MAVFASLVQFSVFHMLVTAYIKDIRSNVGSLYQPVLVELLIMDSTTSNLRHTVSTPDFKHGLLESFCGIPICRPYVSAPVGPPLMREHQDTGEIGLSRRKHQDVVQAKYRRIRTVYQTRA